MLHRLTLLMVVLFVAAPALGVQVGWSVDVRQTQIMPIADDYHIWGVLESYPTSGVPVAPTLIGSEQHAYPCDPNCLCGGVMGSTCHCGPLDNFSYQIGGTPNPNLPQPYGYVGPWPPVGVGPFYYFEANWSSMQHYVGYNDWAHFGLKFDENQANYGYWLQGKWTAGNGTQYAAQNTPIASFEVVDGPGGRLRLANGFNSDPPGGTPIALQLNSVELTALPVGTNFDIDNLCNSFFDIHTEITWSANPIVTPQYIAPSSFFDVFLESVAVPGGGGQTFANLLPGQLLLARQQFSYPVVGGGTETFWEYQMHEVPLPVPEPSSIAMLVLMTGGLLAWRRRR
jgi:hypothetical protein